jgi:hypothetical protein
LAPFSYLLSGTVGGALDGTLDGTLGDTGGIAVLSTGISRQSIAYTKSPFEVLPIGRHTTGLATLLAGGAPARLRATFFISISRDKATTTQFCHAAHCSLSRSASCNHKRRSFEMIPDRQVSNIDHTEINFPAYGARC